MKSLQSWPVGAMVARGPPKAKVVGSSPISVAQAILFCPHLSHEMLSFRILEAEESFDVGGCT
jgi:hypothetical protein